MHHFDLGKMSFYAMMYIEQGERVRQAWQHENAGSADNRQGVIGWRSCAANPRSWFSEVAQANLRRAGE